MGAKYTIRRDEKIVEGKSVSVYGIDFADDSGEAEISVPDISPDRALVSRLAALLNELSPSPVHFLEIVEDFLLS